MNIVSLALKKKSYDILIGHGLIKDCGRLLKGLKIGKDAVIITNGRLLRLYGKVLTASLKKALISSHFEIVPDSEKAKSSKIAADLINRISAYDKGKRLFIIAFGGGVVGDVAGFVAAIYKRGIPYVQIPTTLLAQVDSAIGGKVAIDIPVAKNLIGAFYQPKLVISDTSLLESLPPKQVRNGLAEVIKYGVIKDRPLFEYLEKNLRRVLALDRKALEFIISRSSAIKACIVEKDEFDNKGKRVILNYGHTIGHAIEAASAYSKRYNHGDAVAIGMVAAADIALRLKLIRARDALRIEALIKKAGLPTAIKGLGFSDIYEAQLHDKKFIRGKNRFVLPVKIGRVKVVEGISESIVKAVLRERLEIKK